jgi:drug/metabolite transporter superfamily protein YnfA
MKNRQTHITRFLIIVVMALIGCYFGLTAGRTASAGSANQATPPLPSLRGEAAIEHLKQTGLYHSLAAALTAARYQMTTDTTLTQQQKLEALDAARDDRFGESVAISGETVVVGAPFDNGAGGEDQGSAYVFVRSGGVWSQQQKLEASDPAAFDIFGNSVAISGETIVVGAPFDDGAVGNTQGSAYVFVRSGGVWSQQQKLETADAPGGQFGASVAISGEAIVAGAPSDGPAGSAYIFVRSDGTWSQQQKLEVSDATAFANFGASVAISGETVVVGAHTDDGAAGSNQGAAYVFVRSGGVWSQQQKLEASDAAALERFGFSVAISGETIVVGAFLDNGAAGDGQGSAYVFERSDGVWSQQQKLEASDAAAFDHFGNSVAINGMTIVVGAEDNDSAYIFERSGGVWSQQQKLEAFDVEGGGFFFGKSVAISGKTVVAGGPFYDVRSQGLAFVFAPAN